MQRSEGNGKGAVLGKIPDKFSNFHLYLGHAAVTDTDHLVQKQYSEPDGAATDTHLDKSCQHHKYFKHNETNKMLKDDLNTNNLKINNFYCPRMYSI